MSVPKYTTYKELVSAFKSGELGKGYYLMLDKGGCENHLTFHDKGLSEEENEKKQEGCRDIFDTEYGIESVFDALEIPWEWC